MPKPSTRHEIALFSWASPTSTHQNRTSNSLYPAAASTDAKTACSPGITSMRSNAPSSTGNERRYRLIWLMLPFAKIMARSAIVTLTFATLRIGRAAMSSKGLAGRVV